MMKKFLIIILVVLSIFNCKVLINSKLEENNIETLNRNGVVSNTLYDAIIEMNNYIDTNNITTSKHIFVSFEVVENQCLVLIGSVNFINPEFKGYTLLNDKIISFVVLDNHCVNNQIIQVEKLSKVLPNCFKKQIFKKGDYYSDPWGKKYKLTISGELEYLGNF